MQAVSGDLWLKTLEIPRKRKKSISALYSTCRTSRNKKKTSKFVLKVLNHNIYKAGYLSKIKIGLNEDFANSRNETLAN